MYWYSAWMISVQYRVTGRNAKEISDSLETAIRAEALPPGQPLPSVRSLAGELRVAPGTVALAYKSLRERGLLESRGRSGTFVRPRPPVAARSALPPIEDGVTDLTTGQPDPALLPELPPLSDLGPAPAPAAFVLPEILARGRERLAAEGVPAPAITLAGGGLDAIARVLSAQLRPGDIVAVEDPGWPNALDLVAALGLRRFPIAVDGEGPLPEALAAALRAGAAAVIVTSRAHNPTGAFLTPARADQLRAVLAGHRHTVVIEDDHAAELAGVPLAALAAATDSWAFVRSASKPYGPDLRLALIAGDEATIARVEGRTRVSSGWVSTLLQRLVLHLWTSEQTAAVIAHSAVVYDRRREQLIAELAHRGVPAIGATGLNVWIPVADETAVVTGLLRARWAVAPGSRFRQASEPGVRITISALTSATIPQLAADLATATSATRHSAYST